MGAKVSLCSQLVPFRLTSNRTKIRFPIWTKLGVWPSTHARKRGGPRPVLLKAVKQPIKILPQPLRNRRGQDAFGSQRGVAGEAGFQRLIEGGEHEAAALRMHQSGRRLRHDRRRAVLDGARGHHTRLRTKKWRSRGLGASARSPFAVQRREFGSRMRALGVDKASLRRTSATGGGKGFPSPTV